MKTAHFSISVCQLSPTDPLPIFPSLSISVYFNCDPALLSKMWPDYMTTSGILYPKLIPKVFIYFTFFFPTCRQCVVALNPPPPNIMILLLILIKTSGTQGPDKIIYNPFKHMSSEPIKWGPIVWYSFCIILIFLLLQVQPRNEFVWWFSLLLCI